MRPQARDVRKSSWFKLIVSGFTFYTHLRDFCLRDSSLRSQRQALWNLSVSLAVVLLIYRAVALLLAAWSRAKVLRLAAHSGQH